MDKPAGQGITVVAKDKAPHTLTEYNLNLLYTYTYSDLIPVIDKKLLIIPTLWLHLHLVYNSFHWTYVPNRLKLLFWLAHLDDIGSLLPSYGPLAWGYPLLTYLKQNMKICW